MRLEDRGWEQMSQLLDKEMPRRKRKWGFILLLLGIGVVISSVFIYGYLAYREVESVDVTFRQVALTESNSKHDVAIDENTFSKSEGQDKNIDIEKVRNSFLQKKLNKRSEAQSRRNDYLPTNLKTTNKTINSETEKSTDRQLMFDRVEVKQKLKLRTGAMIGLESKLEKDITFNENHKRSREEIIDFSNDVDRGLSSSDVRVEMLKIEKISIEDYFIEEDSELRLDVSHDLESYRNKRIQFWMRAGVENVSKIFSKSPSWGAFSQIGMNYKFNNVWSASPFLGMTYFDFKRQEKFYDVAYRSLLPDFLTDNYKSQLVDDSKNKIVQKFVFFGGAHVSYRAFDRLIAHIGAGVHFYVDKDEITVSDFGDDAYVLCGDIDKGASTDLLNGGNFSTMGTVGIDYVLNKSFSLGIQYRRDFKKFYEGFQVDTYPNYVNLNLKYLF